MLMVGAPLRFDAKLFNCARGAFIAGACLAWRPRPTCPITASFTRSGSSPPAATPSAARCSFLGERVPFGNDLIFEASNVEGFKLHVEICEDVWTPIPPSTYAALAGATVLANLSASNITIGKADYRRNLCASQSGKCIAAYLYSAAGPGESTTDLAWDGHALDLREQRAAGRSRSGLPTREQMITADIDLERLVQDRMRMTSFNDSVGDCRERVAGDPPHPLRVSTCRRARCPCSGTSRGSLTCRAIRASATSAASRPTTSRCTACSSGSSSTGIKRVVIGVSGGLDSTQALIVAAKTMDRMGLPRKNILAYTMPGFATSELTLDQCAPADEGAGRHRAARSTSGPACMQMFSDIGHPFARGEAGLRCHVRKRAGGRADLAPVPPGQPAQRAGAGHGRLERTGARLDDLRRRRPHVALQRQLSPCPKR